MISDDKKFDLNRMNSQSYKHGLGDLLADKPNVVRARYDFANQGGLVSSINLRKDLSDSLSTVVIPDNAIIKHVYIDILTAMVSAGGTGTIALDSEGAGDLLAAVDADTLSGIVAGIPVNTAATMIKMTADNTLQVSIATEALTAGKFDVYVEYVLAK